MIILNNRGIYGTDVVVYDIHKDTEKEVADGSIAFTETEDHIVVLINLYSDSECWSKGVHHYSSEILDVLKFAEPNLKRITRFEIKKCDR